MNRTRLGTSGGALNNFPVNGSTSDDDDLYSGYNEFPSALNTEDLEFDESFQNSARTLESRRPTALPSRGGVGGMPPGTAYGSRLGTAAGFQRQSTARTGIFTRSGTARPITGIGGESGGLNRPMTAVRGAGYTGSGKLQQGFDPLNSAGSKVSTPSIEPKVEDTVEEKIKQLEEKINDLVEQSVLTSCKGDTKRALELAKEAANKERSLIRLKEQSGTHEGHDWDITFSVMFNLASQYEACEMYTEALTTYHDIAKNKVLAHGAKVKINMGNIYYKQNNPTKAIKMYRMAMDQLNNTNRDLRLKLMHNMGIIFLKMGHPNDAAASFEYIMQERPGFKTGLHLVVACFMAGDPDKMKRAFQDLLDVPVEEEDDADKYDTLSDDPVSQLLVEVLKNDKLRKLEKERKLYAERCVLSAARLIAPAVESTFSEGYHWVTEAIRSSSKHAPLAHALEISKALVCLKQRELSDAIDILKSFEKKETKVATAAATNLSFMFFLQGDLESAEKYGLMASKADYYNSNAYVNLGNCHYAKGEYEEARRSYAEAVQIDASCAEALYNLGLVNQTLKFYEDALTCFHKVQSLVKNHPHVTFQLGRTHELMGENEVAMEWFLKALALNPSDAGVLKKLGELADMEGDRQQAYQHYYDCYKYDPSDLDVIHWIASYLQEMGLPDKALSFYQKALALQPNESRWQMLMGAAYRRVGNYSNAIECFQKVYRDNPENVQALQNLVKLTSDLGMPEADVYRDDLVKLERSIGNRMQSARMRSGDAQGRLGTSAGGAGRGGSMDDDGGFGEERGPYSRGNSSQFGRQGGVIEEERGGIDDYELEMQFGGGGYPTASGSANKQQTRRPETRGGRGGLTRPKTGSRGATSSNSEDADDFFADDEIPADFLPA